MTSADRLRENVALAIDNLRASKLRSALTILGVVIGVSTMMAMAAIVQGIQQQIVHTIEIAGPTTFYVVRVFSQTPINPDQLPKWIRIRPELSVREAERLAQLPSISYASLWGQAIGRLEYQGARTQPVSIFGADDRFTEIMGGELAAGRWFTKSEVRSGAAVVVVQEKAAQRLFGRVSPVGKTLRAGGRPAEVIGVYIPPGNIFTPPSQETGAIVPYGFLDRAFDFDHTNASYISVKPRAGVTVADAQEEATVALREMRKLRPADKNSFDLITQDQILDIFNKLTGAFFLVMIVLSSVGLMVGGIGVMAIMMVSVTNRTREIGVRKALGATRRDIMLQFLVEAATLTGIGGLIGIAAGLGIARVASLALSVNAPPPISLTLVAVVISVGIGIVFGLIPAQRAARLDPVEALRYE
jgi:putative ABC transport system permease protein